MPHLKGSCRLNDRYISLIPTINDHVLPFLLLCRLITNCLETSMLLWSFHITLHLCEALQHEARPTALACAHQKQFERKLKGVTGVSLKIDPRYQGCHILIPTSSLLWETYSAHMIKTLYQEPGKLQSWSVPTKMVNLVIRVVAVVSIKRGKDCIEGIVMLGILVIVRQHGWYDHNMALPAYQQGSIFWCMWMDTTLAQTPKKIHQLHDLDLQAAPWLCPPDVFLGLGGVGISSVL